MIVSWVSLRNDMNKLKILNDQLETIVAEAARVESELKNKIIEKDEIIKDQDAQIRRLYAQLASCECNLIPSNENNKEG